MMIRIQNPPKEILIQTDLISNITQQKNTHYFNLELSSGQRFENIHGKTIREILKEIP